MRGIRTRWLACLALLGVFLTVLVPGAHAAPQPSGPVAAAVDNACGPGYEESDKFELRDAGKVLFGTVYLYWNTTYRSNCVVTVKSVAVGVATYTSAFVCRQSDGKCSIDGGSYRFEADTVPLYAPSCVKWGGGVSGIDGRRVYDERPWGHC